MVAVARLIPKDPEEKESVLAVLREHPELQDFIAHVSAKAEEMFPDVSITLDTVRYDDWDPPVRLLVHITQPWDKYAASSDAFFSGSLVIPAMILRASSSCHCGMDRSSHTIDEGRRIHDGRDLAAGARR